MQWLPRWALVHLRCRCSQKIFHYINLKCRFFNEVQLSKRSKFSEESLNSAYSRSCTIFKFEIWKEKLKFRKVFVSKMRFNWNQAEISWSSIVSSIASSRMVQTGWKIQWSFSLVATENIYTLGIANFFLLWLHSFWSSFRQRPPEQAIFRSF